MVQGCLFFWRYQIYLLPVCEHVHLLGFASERSDREQAVVALHNLALILPPEQLEEAESLLRRAIEERSQYFGPEHFATLGSRFNLALNLTQRGKFEEAEEIFRELIEAQGRTLGLANPETLRSTRVYALLLFNLKREEEARKLCQEILETELPDHEAFSQMVQEQQSRTRDLLKQFE